MWRIRRPIPIVVAAMLLSLAPVASAQVMANPASAPSLAISQLKITSSNGQFITLHNATDTSLDMSRYQLQYFNNYDLTKATSSRLIPLAGTVPPRGYFMLNDSSLLLCYQLVIQSESLGLSSTAGLVQLLNFRQSNPGGAATPVLLDYVAWTKAAAAGAQTLPSNTNAFLRRLPLDSAHHPSITSPGAGSWQAVQPDPTNACNLITATTSPTSVQTGLTQLLPPSEPPAIFMDLLEEASTTALIPAGNIGLMAPQITELLPNPYSTGNDNLDEYIELYNANSKPFDLSGYKLQTGLSTRRTYIFPAGSSLPPLSFTAFYSESTGLSLSNTSSQAELVDPLDNSINATAVYEKAKDGQAWALAKGQWYWTTKLTPNAVNVITKPVAKKLKTTTSKAKTAKSSAVKGTNTKARPTPATTASGFADEPPTTPVHTWTLALVASAALLYGAYEYRTDLANRIYQFRSYLKARRPNRQ